MAQQIWALSQIPMELSFWNHYLRAQSHDSFFVDTWICLRDPYGPYHFNCSQLHYGFPSHKGGFPMQPSVWLDLPHELTAFHLANLHRQQPCGASSLLEHLVQLLNVLGLRLLGGIAGDLSNHEKNHPPSLSFCASKINMKKRTTH